MPPSSASHARRVEELLGQLKEDPRNLRLCTQLMEALLEVGAALQRENPKAAIKPYEDGLDLLEHPPPWFAVRDVHKWRRRAEFNQSLAEVYVSLGNNTLARAHLTMAAQARMDSCTHLHGLGKRDEGILEAERAVGILSRKQQVGPGRPSSARRDKALMSAASRHTVCSADAASRPGGAPLKSTADAWLPTVGNPKPPSSGRSYGISSEQGSLPEVCELRSSRTNSASTNGGSPVPHTPHPPSNLTCAPDLPRPRRTVKVKEREREKAPHPPLPPKKSPSYTAGGDVVFIESNPDLGASWEVNIDTITAVRRIQTFFRKVLACLELTKRRTAYRAYIAKQCQNEGERRESLNAVAFLLRNRTPTPDHLVEWDVKLWRSFFKGDMQVSEYLSRINQSIYELSREGADARTPVTAGKTTRGSQTSCSGVETRFPTGYLDSSIRTADLFHAQEADLQGLSIRNDLLSENGAVPQSWTSRLECEEEPRWDEMLQELKQQQQQQQQPQKDLVSPEALSLPREVIEEGGAVPQSWTSRLECEEEPRWDEMLQELKQQQQQQQSQEEVVSPQALSLTREVIEEDGAVPRSWTCQVEMEDEPNWDEMLKEYKEGGELTECSVKDSPNYGEEVVWEYESQPQDGASPTPPPRVPRSQTQVNPMRKIVYPPWAVPGAKLHQALPLKAKPRALSAEMVGVEAGLPPSWDIGEVPVNSSRPRAKPAALSVVEGEGVPPSWREELLELTEEILAKGPHPLDNDLVQGAVPPSWRDDESEPRGAPAPPWAQECKQVHCLPNLKECAVCIQRSWRGFLGRRHVKRRRSEVRGYLATLHRWETNRIASLTSSTTTLVDPSALRRLVAYVPPKPSGEGTRYRQVIGSEPTPTDPEDLLWNQMQRRHISLKQYLASLKDLTAREEASVVVPESVKNDPRRVKAAMGFQQVWRAYSARLEVERRRLHRRLKNEKRDAAVQIQRIWRGYYCRKRVLPHHYTVHKLARERFSTVEEAEEAARLEIEDVYSALRKFLTSRFVDEIMAIAAKEGEDAWESFWIELRAALMRGEQRERAAIERDEATERKGAQLALFQLHDENYRYWYRTHRNAPRLRELQQEWAVGRQDIVREQEDFRADITAKLGRVLNKGEQAVDSRQPKANPVPHMLSVHRKARFHDDERNDRAYIQDQEALIRVRLHTEMLLTARALAKQ